MYGWVFELYTHMCNMCLHSYTYKSTSSWNRYKGRYPKIKSNVYIWEGEQLTGQVPEDLLFIVRF